MIIKLYEHFKSPNKKERFRIQLQDFCEMYLAYLIDEGFHIEIVEVFNKVNAPSDAFVIKIKSDSVFTWLSISDHFITFYSFLSKKYRLIKSSKQGSDGFVNFMEQVTKGQKTGFIWDCHTDESIFDNSIDPNKIIEQIQICIKIV